MTDDKTQKGLVIADAQQVAGDGADVEAVEQQEEQGAEAQQQAAGEGFEGDADVVHDVEAEHQPVVAAAALAEVAETAGVGVVHQLHPGHLLRRQQAVDQVGKQIDQQAHAQQAAVEQQAGQQDAAPGRAYLAREAVDEEAEQARAEVLPRAVQLLVGAQGEQLQALDQAGAVGAALRQRQLLAQAAVGGGELAGLRAERPALLEQLELAGQGLPVGLVPGFELRLFHGVPRRSAAICCRRSGACSAVTPSSGASSPASSSRRAGDSWRWRSP
ncbi:hypothetical protein D9M71_413630 [compost metagenome]